ncbi:MAG: C4-dicarboxylate TRAP transporter substrate-binding protein [Alphaproteobacteria bacterium]
MNIRQIMLAAAASVGFAAAAAGTSHADTFNFRMASGHAPQTGYVVMMSEQFVPRVKAKLEKLGHSANFNEAYGGSIVKVAETLEGVQDGIVDIGGYCFCFEPSNLFLNVYPLWMPFDSQTATLGTQVARKIYDDVPQMSGVFEENHNQKVLALFGFDNYGLYTNFAWNNVSELKGRKLSGAGPNLPWVESLGAIPVGTTLPDVYPSLQTGVYDGVILFPSVGWSHKLFEPAPFYTIVGFGAKTFHGLTINNDTWDDLPADVQNAMSEAARETEDFTGRWLDELEATNLGRMVQNGATIRKVDDEARLAWAKALADFPNERAKEADSKGLPGSKVVRMAVEIHEDLGHKWPVRYEIK